MGSQLKGNDFRVSDPQGIVEKALQISGPDKREEQIADLVKDAPLQNWISSSRSLNSFYEDARELSRM